MNVYDSKRMEDVLAPLGYTPVETPEGADIIILNTCHIREKATEKAYSDLGRLREIKDEQEANGKRTIIAVAGCTAQAEGAEIIKRAPYVDMVFGPQAYHLLPEMVARAKRHVDLHQRGPGRGIVETDFPEVPKFDLLPQESHPEGPTAFLAVQEGCDKFCHFCIVPYTRGAEYSRTVKDVRREAEDLVRKGVKEITLLGQNVNAYHGESPSGKGEWGLGALIEHLAEIEGLERIRYVTSHPKDVDEGLINAHSNVSKLMPYLHLPIQSGSDSILKAMNRKHTVSYYMDVIGKFRAARKDIAFTSDFIVGYPGESDKDFEETLKVVREVNYIQAYSFKYSKRPGTPAAAMENQVPETVKEERLQVLQGILKTQQTAFNESCVGLEFPILFEKEGRHEGQLIGRSPYLQSVYVHAPLRLIGEIINIRIIGATLNSLKGEVVII